MPKPIRHKGGEVLVGIAASRKQPELSALMYEVITCWSVLDQHISMMFATLLHGKKGDPLEIYYSFFDEGPRRRIFNAMAETRISEELRKEAEIFFQSLRKASKVRNYVAHSTWGTSDIYPDCMLLLDGRYITECPFGKSIMLRRVLAERGVAA